MSDEKLDPQLAAMREKQANQPEWLGFDNTEIMSRLLRRNIDPVTAKAWVRDRGLDYAVEEITSVLDRVYLDENDQEIVFEIPPDRRVRR